MITLHHLENSRSQRIAWLLEEAGVDYDVKHYPRDAKNKLAPPELKAVHPLGKSPVITDGAVTVAESGAIIEYIVERYAADLRPTDPDARRAYTYWLHFAEGSMMPLLVMKLVFGRLAGPPIPFILRPIGKLFAKAVGENYLDPSLAAQLDLVDATLADGPWFAGDTFSGADIQMSFGLMGARARADLSSRPNILRFLEAVEARPAWKAAVDRVGPLEMID